MQALLDILIQTPWLAMVVVAVFGLCVGSFLNVVIHRTPLIMQQGLRQECTTFLHPEQPPLDEPHLTLSQPASRCPACGHQIRWYENIPLISWLALKGRCSQCNTSIGIRYPLVELGTMLASVVVFMVFGPTLTMLAALGMTWMLIALTGIDFDTQLLPDHMTLPLIAAGLLVNTQLLFVTPTQSIVGAVVGFLILWVINAIAKAVMKRDGIGGGDFKLLAALGAWLGPLMLPLILLMSSLIGSVIGLILLRIYKESRPFAFGPYLAIAGWIAMLWGAKIVSSYLAFAHLS
jgi:leader peptidase (prepilin peptidase)/N-methyltransferase